MISLTILVWTGGADVAKSLRFKTKTYNVDVVKKVATLRLGILCIP